MPVCSPGNSDLKPASLPRCTVLADRDPGHGKDFPEQEQARPVFLPNPLMKIFSLFSSVTRARYLRRLRGATPVLPVQKTGSSGFFPAYRTAFSRRL